MYANHSNLQFVAHIRKTWSLPAAPRLSVRGLSLFRVRVPGTLSQQNFASLDSVCPRLRGIRRLNCSDRCYCCDRLLNMVIWLMICSAIIVFRICTLYTLYAITMPWDILECMWRICNNNNNNNNIRHWKESNSQLVPSQAGADTTRPQWRVHYPQDSLSIL